MLAGILLGHVHAQTASYIYDDFGRLQETLTENGTISYTHDDAGNRIDVTVQSGGLDSQIDVGLAVAATPAGSQVIGNGVDYTLTIINFSSASASSLALTFDLDDSSELTTVTGGSWSCGGSDPVFCSLGSLPGGAESQIGIQVLPIGLGHITASASIAHGASDPQPGNDHDSVTTLVVSSGVAGDTDGDGMPDAWETEHGLNPVDAGDAASDPDGDTLSNLDEYNAGTDPNNADTDGDGQDDAVDLNPLFNPAWMVPVFNLLLD